MVSYEKRLAIIEAYLSRKDDKFASNHDGAKTKEVIAQEIKSLLNQWKPETMTKSEVKKYINSTKSVQADLQKLSEEDQEFVKDEIEAFEATIEEVRNFK